MPGIGHVMVGLGAGRLAAPHRTQVVRALVLFGVVSMLPDLDAVGFFLGVPYEATFGHRGATHSLGLSLLVAPLVGLVGHWLGLPARRVAALAFVTLALHAITDGLTDGGLGVALFWPLTAERFFLPWQPIMVAPIGPAALTTPYGRAVLAMELLYFCPFALYALWPRRAGAQAGP